MLLQNFIALFLESAPWLLLGLILAGLLKVFVPMSWMHNQLGGHGLKTTVKAALFGAPLPLCSCGVIPAAVGLRRSGASKAATTSFMVSTPETGIDSVSVSYVLLGPFMAIVRPIAAVISAIVAGLLVGRDDDDGVIASTPKEKPVAEKAACCSSDTQPQARFTPVDACCQDTPSLMQPVASGSSCCSSKAAETTTTSSCCGGHGAEHSHQHHHGHQGDSCCSSTQDTAAELQGTSILYRIGKALQFAATDLVRDTTVWLLVGLFFAALVQTYVPADFLSKWGNGILAMLVMVVISVPMYICATASTPIAAGLLLAGVSPGAVLVFMMAGPATNIATLGVVAKELGKRALWGYLGGVLGVALLSGILVNYLVATFGFEVMPQIGEHHELLPAWLVAGSGILLAVLMGRVLLAKLPRSWWRRDCCS
ncbi:permease [Shewanella sp. NFH-SH190041]|uniref:SO_0444 family Cu/Zn efflux transporter n=1 Tax=Shewanella sp. NFH-SH190041 TaxID=2950245 RepID=UPI0021C2B9B9|nr:SO_0444 family Cu/Zn efflux transporter [Shewanella sp. NFH-SH190041]BDM63032.1 permease [Shewanella sp. NFH-SH190041]